MKKTNIPLIKLFIKIKLILSPVLFFLPTNGVAQIVSGKIVNNAGNLINHAIVIAKDSSSSTSLKAFAIAKNGHYSLKLPKSTTQIVIEVSSLGYFTSSYGIDNIDSTTNNIFDFVLIRDTAVLLEPVILKAKVRPYNIKGDTTSFKVSSYVDGTERKIQDVIRKLPGVEVNEKTGEIKYKGKLVETVKLDGDDLFGGNYSIGTKNINVDIVDEIQAIENYSSNPLLTGIETGDNVALNLTLKKNDIDFSGEIDLGVGSFKEKSAQDIAVNLLGISKKYKSFSTSSFNNIGENNTPFDYYSNSKSVEQILNESSLAPKYLGETTYNTSIDDKRQNINNNFWSSYNGLHKIGKKGSIKTNLYYLTDKIESRQYFEDNNQINGQFFTTSDEYFFTKKPLRFGGDVGIKIFNTTTSLFEYQGRYIKENTQTSNQIIQNKIRNINSNLETKDNLFENKITYTNRISAKKALNFTAKYTTNKIPQSATYRPAIIDPLIFSSNAQFSSFEKKNFVFQTTLLGNNSKNSKYKSSITTDFKSINYSSLLTGFENNNISAIPNFHNDIKYDVIDISFKNQYSFLIRKVRIMPVLDLKYVNQKIVDNQNSVSLKKANFLIQPFLNIALRTGIFSKTIILLGYNQKPFNEINFVPNQVLLSNRDIQQNSVSLDLQRTKSINIIYTSLNLSKSFELFSNIFFANNKGNYFSKFEILQNQTIITNFYLPASNNNFIASFSISKYLSAFKGTLKLRSNLSANSYKNVVNNSTLRSNHTSILTSELFYKTTIKRIFIIDNTISNSFMQTKSEDRFKTSNLAISNSFQFVYKISDKGYIALTNDYFLPNIKQKKESYFFFDLVANLKTKNKLYDFTLKLKNISNTKYIRNFQTIDYATSVFQTNLLTRHFIFSVLRNF